MSSDIIKVMAAKILANIKSQYPDNYNDNNKKEQLVRTILSKIDHYSKYINRETGSKVANKIITEISINQLDSK